MKPGTNTQLINMRLPRPLVERLRDTADFLRRHITRSRYDVRTIVVAALARHLRLLEEAYNGGKRFPPRGHAGLLRPSRARKETAASR